MTAVAIEQKDWDEVSQLLNTRLRLITRNAQAIALNEPGFMEYLLAQEETYAQWAEFGVTNRELVKAIHRGQVDPWARD